MRGRFRLPFFVFPLPVLALFVLAACATGYHPRGILGAGFSERKLAPSLWLVTFDASVFTPQERLQTYLLLRCAEITVDNGAGYFAILAEGAPMRRRSTKPGLIDQPPFPMEGSPGEPRTVYTRSVRAEIQLYSDRPEEKVYDARELIRRLNRKT